MTPKPKSVRTWLCSRERMTKTGMVFTRALAAYCEGWVRLTDTQKVAARDVSLAAVGTDDGVSLMIPAATYARLEAIQRELGTPMTRMVDILSHAWLLLTYEQQRDSISASIPEPESDPYEPPESPEASEAHQEVPGGDPSSNL